MAFLGHSTHEAHLPAISVLEPRPLGGIMDKAWILALALCFALAGCTSSPDASDNVEDESQDEASGEQGDDSGRSTDSPGLDPGTQDLGRLTLTDCFQLLGFVPKIGRASCRESVETSAAAG